MDHFEVIKFAREHLKEISLDPVKVRRELEALNARLEKEERYKYVN